MHSRFPPALDAVGRSCVRWASSSLLLLAACGGGGSEFSASPAAAVDAGTQALAAPPAPAAPPALTASNLAVVFDVDDPTSEAMARAYQAARGIADRHVFGVRLPRAGSATISAAEFAQLKSTIDTRLDDQAQAILVTWRQPSRVQGACSMSLTSALAFGFDASRCGVCSRTEPSPYFDHDTAQPWTDLRMRPAMMLGAATLAEAQALIRRGLAAEGLMSLGVRARGWLVRTSDVARSVRYPDFQQLAAAGTAGVDWHYVDNAAGAGSNIVADQPDVMFYLTGLERVALIASNRWLPGAVADHLTSFGGVLPDALGQMPATDWLAAGATGSYGTVEEPCNYVQKFPRASVLVHRYSRGETLIEAYWKSVQWPGQGLFVGDPLARPWSRI
jgi:uncharacterized protein (TIGR03790 family)